MKLCNEQGNGVCINCNRIPPKGSGDICRYIAEEMLDLLKCLLDSKLTQEQKDILEDFGIKEASNE